MHAFAGRFVARGRGGIVLTSALGAFQGLPNMAHDSAAKAYVLNLGEALHHELAPAGVDVTVLLPGSVDTPVIDTLGLRRTALPIRPQPAHAAVPIGPDERPHAGPGRPHPGPATGGPSRVTSQPR